MSQTARQRRLPRRRFLKLATTAAVLGGLGVVRPGFGGSSPKQPAPLPWVRAEDIVHGPRELARGEARGLAWRELRAAGLQPTGSEAVYTSPVVRTSFPFSHVGLHWRAETASLADLRFEARTSADGWRWSPWRALNIEAEPGQAARGETFASLLNEEQGRYLQYRAYFDGGAAAPPRLEYVVATVLQVSSLQFSYLRASAKTPTPTATATPRPSSLDGTLPVPEEQFLSREQWGAAESLRFYTNRAEIWPRMYVPVKKVVVHHTATLANLAPPASGLPNPNYSREQAEADVRAIYYYHAVTQGWGDIGYNALIDRFGRVFEGRYGRDAGRRRELLSPQVVAGHVKYANHGADGVALIGHFEANELGPTEWENMVPAMLDYLEWDLRRHGLSPTGTSNFLRIDGLWLRGLSHVCGHRDCGLTTCPGYYLYGRLPHWRQELERRFPASETGPTVDLAGPDGTAIPGDRVSFTWEADGADEFAYYLEGWTADIESGDVFYVEGFTSDKRPDWSDYRSLNAASLGPLEPARYTFHVKAKDARGREGLFEANRTFVVGLADRRHRIGVPGVVKD